MNAPPPLAPGSVSMRLYPHTDMTVGAIVDELLAQADLASGHGFDGVMTSEHHGGFAGYLPNPLQVAGWLLDVMAVGWAAACPLLLTLRPVALVAEEVAWLAARFPGRVGVGVAAGALATDFEIAGVARHDVAGRFSASLSELAAILAGVEPGLLAEDPAVARCCEHPVPVVSAAASPTAARRAADNGVGLILDSLSTPDRCRRLTDAYRQAGGTGPCVLVRRAWLGDPPVQRFDRQVDVYRSYASGAAQSQWGGDELAGGSDPAVVADALAGACRRAGADALNLRVHVPGVGPEDAREQIRRLGDEVVPELHRHLA